MSYLQTVADVYAEAAQKPDGELCCVQSPVWQLPDLAIPPIMLQMNYGCGSTVNPRDLRPNDTVLYVGVGGGLEALQFAYYTRRPGAVIAVDPVSVMRDKARANLEEAARLNPWFRFEFVTLLDGTAFELPAASGSVSIAAQNCLFNIFKTGDLARALSEVTRVLKLGGMFTTSDPVSPVVLPEELAADEQLRARCIAGCLTVEQYLQALTGAGFGRVDVRAKFPYRHLDPRDYPALEQEVMLESIEAAAFKVPDGPDGPSVFTGRTATYTGPGDSFDDPSGTHLRKGIPVEVSDAAAARLAGQRFIHLTPPTWHAMGGGCC